MANKIKGHKYLTLAI